mgnify:CR=1 FL=1
MDELFRVAALIVDLVEVFSRKLCAQVAHSVPDILKAFGVTEHGMECAKWLDILLIRIDGSV